MKLFVENFGKIKFACVELNGYSIFVGDNNSGKTYLMQLIYGVTEAIKSIQNFESTLFTEYPFRVNMDNLALFQRDLDQWFEQNKEKIVKDTFHSDISIGSLSLVIDPQDVDNNFIVLKKVLATELDKVGKQINFLSDVEKKADSYLCMDYKDCLYVVTNDFDGQETIWKNFYLRILLRNYLNASGLKSLYLPASRTGFNLVYRDLLAAMAKPREYDLSLPLGQVPESKKMGLTQPVFDYLIFLQTYKSDENQLKKNKELIDFINRFIIKGAIVRNEDEIHYITDSGVDLPLYLASSMANELTPIIHLLTSVEPIQRLLYDEIETSQHPTTQIQLARLMNRLVNSGVNLIVSTHSDTMAALISNLVMLSFVENGLSKAKELGYEEADLLKEDCVHAYQFEKNEDGSTTVNEIEKFINLGIGYDFSLFNKTNKKIYNDYLVVKRKDV